MRQLILGLLLLADGSLYDLQRRFASSVSLFYSASFGSIARALSALAADGLVTVTAAPGDPRGKKIYRITDAGEKAWRAWMGEEIPASTETERAILSRVFFAGLLPDGERSALFARLHAAATSAGDALALRYDEAKRRVASTNGAEREIGRFQNETLRYGIAAGAALESWLSALAEESGTAPATGDTGRDSMGR